MCHSDITLSKCEYFVAYLGLMYLRYRSGIIFQMKLQMDSSFDVKADACIEFSGISKAMTAKIIGQVCILTNINAGHCPLYDMVINIEKEDRFMKIVSAAI